MVLVKKSAGTSESCHCNAWFMVYRSMSSMAQFDASNFSKLLREGQIFRNFATIYLHTPLHIPDPLSTTRAAISSSSAMVNWLSRVENEVWKSWWLFMTPLWHAWQLRRGFCRRNCGTIFKFCCCGFWLERLQKASGSRTSWYSTNDCFGGKKTSKTQSDYARQTPSG